MHKGKKSDLAWPKRISPSVLAGRNAGLANALSGWFISGLAQESLAIP